jgi:hypothetical protein
MVQSMLQDYEEVIFNSFLFMRLTLSLVLGRMATYVEEYRWFVTSAIT